MKVFAEIINNKTTQIVRPQELYNTEDPEELNNMFAPEIVFIEISEDSPVDTGWLYNYDTGEFTEPEPESEPGPSSEEITLQKIEQLQTDNMILLMSLADIYAEIQALKGGGE